MTLQLKKVKPFAQGGNRLCFVHPDDPARCIKVRRPDFTLADCRRKKGFPRNLRPLSSFDDNREEFRVMTTLENRYGEVLFHHVSRCYGFEGTDMGRGLVSELIRNDDGRISETLKKYLWDHGMDDPIVSAVKRFTDFWLAEGVPSRDLLLHNIVVQIEGGKIDRLVVIDGLGSSSFISALGLPRYFSQRKAQRKIDNLHVRIEQLLGLRGGDMFPGYHGLLIHDGHSGSAPGENEN